MPSSDLLDSNGTAGGGSLDGCVGLELGEWWLWTFVRPPLEELFFGLISRVGPGMLGVALMDATFRWAELACWSGGAASSIL